MKWKWIALLIVFKNVYTLDLPYDSWKQPQPSNLLINSNKSINKARHKSSKIPNPATKSSSDSDITYDVLEPYFPDVIYPTSILDSAQPFYYSQTLNGDVLGPFSNDVKTTYKTLTSGKEKHNYISSGTSVSKPTEKNHINESFDDEKLENVAVIDENPLVLCDETTNSVEEVGTVSYENSLFYIENQKEFENEKEKGSYSGQEKYKNITDYDYLDENIVLDTFQAMDIEYPINSKTSVNLVDLHNETFIAVENKLFAEGTTSNNTTIYMAPNYIMTSNTRNSHDDFVSDIINIYSLIEETVKALSVIDFIISKTLGALDLEDKRNLKIAQNIDFNSSITNCPYDDNITTLYDDYKCDVIEYLPIFNLTDHDDVLMKGKEIESTTQTRNMETDENNTGEIYFNENHYEQDCTVDGTSYDDNITTLYDGYECDVIDYLPVCNLTNNDDVLMKGKEIESTTQTSNIKTDEHITGEKYFYEYRDEQDYTVDGTSESNITSINDNN